MCWPGQRPRFWCCYQPFCARRRRPPGAGRCGGHSCSPGGRTNFPTIEADGLDGRRAVRSRRLCVPSSSRSAWTGHKFPYLRYGPVAGKRCWPGAASLRNLAPWPASRCRFVRRSTKNLTFDAGRAAQHAGLARHGHSAQALKRKGDGTVPLDGAFRRAPWRHKNPHFDGLACSRSMHGTSLRRWVRTADRLRMRRSLVPAAHGARTALGRLTPAIGAQPSRAQETALFLVRATVGRPATAMGNGPSRKPSKSMPLSVR